MLKINTDLVIVFILFFYVYIYNMYHYICNYFNNVFFILLFNFTDQNTNFNHYYKSLNIIVLTYLST